MRSSTHILGIGGIGASALAQILAAKGEEVTGCDPDDTPWIHEIIKNGIPVEKGHDPSHIANASRVIYSLAVPENHPELLEARRRGIETLTYPQAVGKLTEKMQAILVAGTHGKTTVASMLAKIFIEAQMDPTVIVGALLPELGKKNFRVGKSNLFILEACEYMRAFLEYSPVSLVITNIEHDHFDTYPTFDSYVEAFRELTSKVPENGFLVGNADDAAVKSLGKAMITFGSDPQDDFSLQGNEILHHGKKEGELSLKIPGEHNRKNALAAFAMARTYNISAESILKSLSGYRGASRRMEFLGEMDGVKIFDDYGHHPTEIRATLSALREKFPREKICVVYQPHQFNRSIHLLNEFSESFSQADEVIVPDIYAARDTKEEKAEMSAEKFAAEIAKHHPRVHAGGGLEKTASELLRKWKDFDVVVIMGAGDVWKVGRELLDRK